MATPQDDRNRRLTAVLKIAVPAFLVLLFAAIAILANGGFRAQRPVSTVPAAAKIDLTRLSVVNRLEGAGFVWNDGTLTRDGETVASLTLEPANAARLTGAAFVMRVQSGDEELPNGRIGDKYRAERDEDIAVAEAVFDCLLEAGLGGSVPYDSVRVQGKEAIRACISSSEANTSSLTAGTKRFTFSLTPPATSRQQAEFTMTLGSK